MSILYPGMRAGLRNRRKWNDARRAALRPYWMAITAWSGALVVMLVLCAWLMVVAGVPAFVSGMLIGAGLATYGAALHWIVDIVSGDHRNKYGARGEESTAVEFRSREMRRRGWCVIDGIPFDRCDVDHVAMRPGGLRLPSRPNGRTRRGRSSKDDSSHPEIRSPALVSAPPRFVAC